MQQTDYTLKIKAYFVKPVNEIRKYSVSRSATFAEFVAKTRQAFGCANLSTLSFAYLDEEKDWVQCDSEDEWQEVKASKQSLLRIKVLHGNHQSAMLQKKCSACLAVINSSCFACSKCNIYIVCAACFKASNFAQHGEPLHKFCHSEGASTHASPPSLGSIFQMLNKLQSSSTGQMPQVPSIQTTVVDDNDEMSLSI